jgi:methyl acetate hydrolase
VVEGALGERLDAVLAARVLGPLGMADTAFTPTPSMRPRRASMHQRGKDGGLTAVAFELPEEPEVFMGGAALFGTVPDYMRFLRMWLNDGMGENGRVLKPETIAYAARDQLGA